MPDINPLEVLEDVEVIAPGRRTGEHRARRCSSEVRAMMSRALSYLDRGEVGNSTSVDIDSFERLGLKNKYQIISALQSCPESDYIDVKPTDDKIMLTLLEKPELKSVRWYRPRRFREDGSEIEE
jgi:hypothetical protein